MDIADTMILITDLVGLLFSFANPALPPTECPMRDHVTQEIVGYLAPCPKGRGMNAISFSGH
jgi:hypothetical protein